ncbi:HMG domain-containing protein 3 [Carassius gibelio]|uniref:HMG domain-containing protein 3 n=1 Tax=Carassius gibelio TaxID=101364 RepID=UPI002277DEBC|nr:HMG domain-containing protein 3 [Carassius gibelio]XP_052471600.1 HMG domain-containing protein 3 [Carassius gibelio]
MEAIYGEMEVESCYTLLELPSPKKKRKSKGSVESADKPKKPRSAYLLYYFDVHQSVQQEHPDLPQSEINKCISDSWKRLNVADRGFYLERARMEKDGIDPSSQSAAAPSQDVPGFRKILPRANYVLLPKSSAGGEQVEGDGEPEALVDGAPRAPETLVSPMTLGSEVELTEQCIAIEALSEDAPTQSATETLPALLVKREESRVTYGDVGMAIESGMEGGALMPQIKADATHLVAIIPNQRVLENKVINTASPIMMFPLVSSVKPEPKPSFKLPIKYTRRGRGSCTTPGCVFSYVTRHKPPQCPDCGQHLGGKWVAAGKRSSVKSSEPSSGKQCVDSKPRPSDPNETSSKDTERTEEQTSASVITQKPSSDKAPDGGTAAARRAARRKRERVNASSAQQTPDGSAVKTSAGAQSAECTAVLSLGAGQIQVVTREKASSALQKRRIRAILPAPAQNNAATQSAVVQWITVPPEKVKSDANVIKAVKPSANEQIAGLKPSTLKQLGHMITPSALQQKPITVSSNQYIITDNGVKILSMLPFKKTAGSSLALGLSTARGRGRCKNPACDYVYKNRHKPQRCPTCGCELINKLTKKSKLTLSAEDACASALLLDASQPLSSAQKEQQRHSTVGLLRSCLQFPESESELQDVFSLIQQLNGQQKHSEDSSGWPSFFEPAATHCSLCQDPLLKGDQSSLAGLEECWLLTECLIRPVTLQLKVCTNLQCLAIHSFTDLHPGLFNVGNKLLVTLDLFFKMRHQIRLGDDPAHAALSIIKHSLTLTDCALSSDQLSRVQDLFCSGYWAFECLTVRDYNDMICGVCGIAPKLEIAQRNSSNVLLLKNVEFTWPDFQATEEVHVDEFWLTMENEALEQAAFPSSFPITRFDASIIAPFIPPLMRNTTVINTEKDKVTSDTQLRGDPSVLVRLIHEGRLIPNQMDVHSEEELRDVLEKCGTPAAADADKDELLASVSLLYSHSQNGLWTAQQPGALLTAGRVSKVCPHQVVCGSKYIVRRESARDHLDLLVSSRFWPPVYVADCAQKVALCTDVLYPELASQMWGKNQGCFSDPTTPPQYVSCSELQDQPYSLDLTATESNPHLHPLTKSTSRWIVRPDAPDALHDAHHAISLCKELEPYTGAVAEICDDPEGETSINDSSATAVRRKALTFDNAAYYYLYNRLLDFLSSRDIVNQQIAEALNTCQPGEVVMIRDALYRLGVAQINSDPQETADGGLDKHSDGVVFEEVMLI